MRRREFLIVVGAAAAWPFAGLAEQAGKVHRIGFLRVGPPPPSFIEPLQTALKTLGYSEGKNLVFEYGLAKRVAELPDMAAELVRRKVDVLVASGTPAVIPAVIPPSHRRPTGPHASRPPPRTRGRRPDA